MAGLNAEQERLRLFAERDHIQTEQMDALRLQIEAMDRGEGILLGLQQRQQERIAKLEESLSNARKRTVLGVLIGIVAGIVIRR